MKGHFSWVLLTLLLVSLLLASCSMDSIKDFANSMGSNAAGDVTHDVSPVANGQDLEKTKADNPNLGLILDGLLEFIGGEAPETLLEGIDDGTRVQIIQNLTSDAGKNKLEALKKTPANLDKKGEEVLQNTAKLFKTFTDKLPVESDNTEIAKLATALKENMDRVATEPENANLGDVIALQSLMHSLDKIANVLPKEGVKLNYVTEDGTEVSRMVAGPAIFNTLTNNDSYQEEPENSIMSKEEIEAFMASDVGTESIVSLVVELQDFVNIVGATSNFTGGVNVTNLVSSLLGGGSNNNGGVKPDNN